MFYTIQRKGRCHVIYCDIVVQNMKFSVTSYSFQKYLNEGKYNHLTLIEKVKEMGFDAIEYTDLMVPQGMTEAEFAEKIAEEAKRCSLEIANYTIGADFINGSDGDFEKEVERVKAKVDVASILGVKGMRHDATGGFRGEDKAYKGFDQALPILIEGCRQVTEYAETKGIKTMVENHGFFCQDSQRVEKLVTGVAHKNFGLLLDVGNFLCADENPVEAFGRLINYIAYAHAKDFYVRSGMGYNPGCGFFKSRGGNYLRGAIIGQGDAPVKQCVQIAKNAGYDGYFSVEFEGIEDPEMGIAQGLKNLKMFAECE